MELFLSMTGLKMVHVPYKGQGPATIDLLAGHVSLMMGNMLSALPHVKNGRLRVYGVTSIKRATVAPDVPTIAEAGVSGFEVVQWFGVLAPANTPRDYSYMRTIMKSAMIFDALVAAGIPEIKGVYAPECGGGRMFVIVAIKQRYAGHARQAGFIASQCREAAYMGKYTVVVDEDIDVTNLEDVLWAICTRTDLATSIDFIHRAWASKAAPMLRHGEPPFNSRAIIDACRPYEWFDDFPKVAQADPAYLRELEQKWRDIFTRQERGRYPD